MAKMVLDLPNITKSDIVLVTNGTSTVGTALINMVKVLKVPGKWYFVSTTDYDLRDPQACMECFSEVNPTYVVHLAYNTYDTEQGISYWYDNVAISNNVLAIANKHNVRRCVLVIPTDTFTQCKDGEWSTCKGAAYMLYQLGIWYNSDYNRFVYAIVPTVYGPKGTSDSPHTIDAIVAQAYDTFTKPKDITTHIRVADVSQFAHSKDVGTYPCVFSSDVAQVVMWMLSNYDSCTPIMVTSSDTVTIGDIVRIVSKNLDIHPFSYTPSSVPSVCSEYPSVAELMPTFEFTSLDIGLGQTISSYMKQV